MNTTESQASVDKSDKDVAAPAAPAADSAPNDDLEERINESKKFMAGLIERFECIASIDTLHPTRPYLLLSALAHAVLLNYKCDVRFSESSSGWIPVISFELEDGQVSWPLLVGRTVTASAETDANTSNNIEKYCALYKGAEKPDGERNEVAELIDNLISALKSVMESRISGHALTLNSCFVLSLATELGYECGFQRARTQTLGDEFVHMVTAYVVLPTGCASWSCPFTPSNFDGHTEADSARRISVWSAVFTQSIAEKK